MVGLRLSLKGGRETYRKQSSSAVRTNKFGSSLQGRTRLADFGQLGSENFTVFYL
jgi:hypothetical protein